MKIIEALKTLKANKEKVIELSAKVKANSARTSVQTSPYGDEAAATKQVKSWLDTIASVLRNNEELASRVHKTNNATIIDIEIGGKVISKSIDEWLRRRNEGVDLELMAFSALTDRGLKEELIKNADGTTTHVTIVRHFDAIGRDNKLSELSSEKRMIDSALEIANATTDLV